MKEMATEKRPVSMTHQQVIWRVEEFVKQARKEEEEREREEAEHKGICLTNLPYHKRKFEEEAERIEIASTLHKRDRTSTKRDSFLAREKARGRLQISSGCHLETVTGNCNYLCNPHKI